jgi:hypothetical protein
VNPYARALLRFWWLILIGVAAGFAVTIVVAKKHKPTTWYASVQVMVDSADRPFFRTAVTSVQQQPPRTQVITPRSNPRSTAAPETTAQVVTVPGQAQIINQSPDTAMLISAANFYPELVTSDAVTKLRERLFGVIPGNVGAAAMFAGAGQNRYRPSPFPIVQINVVSPTGKAAVRLATSTAIAFQKYVTRSQVQSHIPPKQRIIFRLLKTPQVAVPLKHKHLGLAILVGVVVIAAFLALAIGLDRIFSRRTPASIAAIESQFEQPQQQQPTQQARQRAPV